MKRVAPALALLLCLGCPGRADPQAERRQVVVYCALDRLFAQPVLEKFQEETGIEVLPKWDTEATKTTGLVEAIRAEASAPRCDVFWNNEVGQTIALADEGLLEPYDSPAAAGLPAWARDPQQRWTGFAARARVLIVNTELVPPDERPDSLDDLLDPAWKGRIGFAKPLFGTTATHVAALWSRDPEEAKALLQGLLANDAVICAGNADVMKRVKAGELAFGLTDTDDANLAILDQGPVVAIFPDQGPAGRGTLVIPNSVALIKGAPHSEAAKQLIDYLLSAEVEQALAASRSLQIPLREGAERGGWLPAEIKPLELDWPAVGEAFAPSRAYVEESFLGQ